MLRSSFRDKFVTNIRTKAANDDDSRLGVYMKVNPELLAPPQYGDRNRRK